MADKEKNISTEETIKKYLNNGGELFIIRNIQTIRDGGTKQIDTTKQKFFVDKDTHNIHSAYPTIETNLITDSLLIFYIIDRIDAYNKQCVEDVERNKNLLLTIKENLK